jgi:hypothetical protein
MVHLENLYSSRGHVANPSRSFSCKLCDPAQSNVGLLIMIRTDVALSPSRAIIVRLKKPKLSFGINLSLRSVGLKNPLAVDAREPKVTTGRSSTGRDHIFSIQF